MKVLIINEFTRVSGGIDNVVYNTLEGLKEHPGVKVSTLSINHNDFDRLNFFKKVHTIISACRGTYNYKELKKTIKEFEPDVIHVHNMYPLLSKTIIRISRLGNLNILYHLHNFHPYCLNSYFYTKNNICNKCLHKKSWFSGIFNKCYLDSFILSLLISLIRVSPVKWNKKYGRIKKFIAVSNFVKNKYIEAGIPENKIHVLYNPVTPLELANRANDSQNYVFFIGRLAKPKGTDTLIKLIQDNPKIKFKIAGTGPEEKRLLNLSQKYDNLELLGDVRGKQKSDLIYNSKFVIVPSQWWETFGLVVIEANSFGKKVIASNIGGISELIDDGLNGYLIDNRDYEAFNKAVNNLFFQNESALSEDNLSGSYDKYSVYSYTNNLLKLYSQI